MTKSTMTPYDRIVRSVRKPYDDDRGARDRIDDLEKTMVAIVDGTILGWINKDGDATPFHLSQYTLLTEQIASLRKSVDDDVDTFNALVRRVAWLEDMVHQRTKEDERVYDVDDDGSHTISVWSFDLQRGLMSRAASYRQPRPDEDHEIWHIWSHDEDFLTMLHQQFSELETLLMGKRQDYGTSNIDEMGAYGVVTRLGDKVQRLRTLLDPMRFTGPNYEPIEDTWKDIVGYGLLGLMQYRLEQARKGSVVDEGR